MTISLTTNDIAGDAPALLKIIGAVTGTAPATGSGPGQTVDFFPADPTLAPFPSPENSQIVNTNGVIGGRPYLKDLEGTIHTLKLVNGVVQWFKGAGLEGGKGWPGDPSIGPLSQLLVRQGKVFCENGSMWKDWTPVSIYNATLPPAWTTGGPAAGGTPGLPALPAMPQASAIVPGSTGKVINAGPTRTIKTLTDAIAAAGPGDSIVMDIGSYTDTPPAWGKPLLIDLGRGTWDATGKTASLARGKGLLVPCADSIIQNGTIVGVAMDQPFGQLTSAIRPDAGCGYLTIRNMTLSGNQCGVGHGGFPIAIGIETSVLSGNGLKANSGLATHNLYVGPECVKLSLTGVTSRAPVEGHAIKYRGPQLIVSGGTFASANGKPFDLPDGATVPFSITGATILKGANDPDHGILTLGVESQTNGLAGGSINGGTIAAACPNPAIRGPGGTVTLSGVTVTGSPLVAEGGIVLK